MKERPILFKDEMVRAILEGRKTQTRRIVKPQPKQYELGTSAIIGEDGVDFMSLEGDSQFRPFKHGRIGERLWVKETYTTTQHNKPVYRADSRDSNGYVWNSFEGDPDDVKWKPSIFMPRSYSRITLEIVNVRVEKLQEISGEDAIAEGISIPRCGCEVCSTGTSCTVDATQAIMIYRTLWESINGEGSWEANPWVWVIEFKRIE